MFRKVPVESVLVYSGSIENAVIFGKDDKPKIDKISWYTDFEFNQKGFIARKASGIGTGKQFDLDPLDQPARYNCSIHLPFTNEMIAANDVASINPKYCLPTKLTPRLMKFQGDTEEVSSKVSIDTGEDKEEEDTANDGEEVLEDGSSNEIIEDTVQMAGSLYCCPVSGCVCVYKSLDRYRQHARGKRCKIRLRKRGQKGEIKYK